MRDLARQAGIPLVAFEQHCSHHYHLTAHELLTRIRVERASEQLLASEKPMAEIASELGFAAFPAFAQEFHRRMRISPTDYRSLLRTTRCELSLPRWLALPRLLAYLGRDPASIHQRLQGRCLGFAMEVAEQSGVVRLELRPGRAVGQAEVLSHKPDPRWGPALHQRVLRLLGLGSNPPLFERRLAPELRGLIAGQRGLTIPQTHDLWDGLIWVVVGQQVSLGVAFSLRLRLTARFGRKVGGDLALLPRCETIANLAVDDLRSVGFSGRKAEYLIQIARDVVAGTLDLAVLAQATAPEVERRLLAVRGLGPWSVHYLMMRALGFRDCVPVGDVVLAKSLAQFFGLPARPDAQQTLALMDGFVPFRSLATFHLWSRCGLTQ